MADCDRECDQLLGLRIEGTWFHHRTMKIRECLHHIGDLMAEISGKWHQSIHHSDTVTVVGFLVRNIAHEHESGRLLQSKARHG